MGLPTPYYADRWCTLYHGDCRDILPLLPAESIDLVLTDPPYGISYRTSDARSVMALARNHPPVFGDDSLFDPRPLLRWRCVLWGANYYADKLPVRGSWFVWYKRVNGKVNYHSDAELAWSSAHSGVRVFHHLWQGMLRDSERGEGFHPTQKPVALMSFCLRWARPTGIVLDPYMGSGSVAVACAQANIPYIGIEIEERYCEIAANRLRHGVFDFAPAETKREEAEALLPMQGIG